MSEKILQTSDATFAEDVLQSELPVLLDFWAEWCGPCKMIAPLLDKAAEDYDGRLKVVKFNIDENPNTPPKYGIRSIPTMMIFKNGQVQAQKVGGVSAAVLSEFIDTNL
ncbi:MAG: thioredoxin TrxA [Pseudomonadota bacterium]